MSSSTLDLVLSVGPSYSQSPNYPFASMLLMKSPSQQRSVLYRPSTSKITLEICLFHSVGRCYSTSQQLTRAGPKSTRMHTSTILKYIFVASLRMWTQVLRIPSSRLRRILAPIRRKRIFSSTKTSSQIRLRSSPSSQRRRHTSLAFAYIQDQFQVRNASNRLSYRDSTILLDVDTQRQGCYLVARRRYGHSYRRSALQSRRHVVSKGRRHLELSVFIFTSSHLTLPYSNFIPTLTLTLTLLTSDCSTTTSAFADPIIQSRALELVSRSRCSLRYSL